MPQMENVFAIVGFSIIDGVNEPNAGFIVPTIEAVRGPRRRSQLGAGADRHEFSRRASRCAPPM